MKIVHYLYDPSACNLPGSEERCAYSRLHIHYMIDFVLGSAYYIQCKACLDSEIFKHDQILFEVGYDGNIQKWQEAVNNGTIDQNT